MGSDEHVSREEFAVFAEYIFAKLAQIGTLLTIAIDGLTADEAAKNAISDRIAAHPATQREQDALAALEEFEEIRKIAYRYFGPI